ncbi:MAG: DUF5615 family PIN-like protein [Chloroflexi bacterium]|nr:DUF5615 family PIN-like protein [Chloroflexota bacterium]
MKLLFDQNFSRHLAGRLADGFPESDHVLAMGLARATDREVWQFAREHDFMVVSKDDDFNELARLLGSPPKVIHLAIGNSTTTEVEAVLRSSIGSIREFNESPEALLVIGRGDR